MKATLTFKKKDPWSGHKVYDNCKHAISSYIMRSGIRYTGFNGKDYDVARKRLEEEIGVDLRPSSSYWDNFAIFLGSQDVQIDTELPEQELKWYFLKGHKRVAMGLNDTKASTDYILLQAEEEAKTENLKARARRRATIEFEKLSTDDMRKALRLFGYNSDNNSPDIVENTLYQLVEENPKRFISIWVDNKTKDTEFLIEEACAKGIIRKQNTVYKYGSDVIGYTIHEAIVYLDNPANGDLKATILAQLEGKEISFGSEKPEDNDSESQFAKLKQEIDKEESTSEVKKQTKTKK